MFEKLKSVIDLKGIMMAGAFIGSLFIAYDKIGIHDIAIHKHNDIIQELEKVDTRMEVRIDVLEIQQKQTDGKFEKLNDSITKLNETMIKLSTIIEKKL